MLVGHLCVADNVVALIEALKSKIDRLGVAVTIAHRLETALERYGV